MTREETQSEKIDTQKELLTFEEKHGRPVNFNLLFFLSTKNKSNFKKKLKQTKLEKDLMRPLYDHYRKVKRILTKNASVKFFEMFGIIF